ncbi:MAG: Gfo/Idh/MocA family oxidoreductase [Anaerolineales bacterium]
MPDALRVGLVGWGLAGRYFHGPFLQTNPHFDLRYVVTSRQPEPNIYPQLKRLATLDDLLAQEDTDLVVIATPHHLHEPQARAALRAGRHVLVEKPAAPSVAAWHALQAEANRAGREVFVFQNRRWDADFLTVQHVIQSGMLGPVYHLENRWPYYRPSADTRAPWKADAAQWGGVLYDLMPHLIDQALALFGPPQWVSAQMATLHPQRGVTDFVRATFSYDGGWSVLLEVDSLNADLPPRFQVRGLGGTFTQRAGDGQEARLRAGELPDQPGWGRIEGGLLRTPTQQQRIAAQAGNYHNFYTALYDAIINGAAPPIAGDDITWQLNIIAAIQRSAEKQAIEKM